MNIYLRKAIYCIVVAIICYMATRISKWLTEKIFSKKSIIVKNPRRANTFKSVVSNMLKVAIYFIAVLTILAELGVSKTSLMRYLNSLGVNTFTSFREIITLESIKGITALETIKYNYKEEQLDKQAVKLGKIIKEAKRVIVLGGGNCFSLMIYMKAFIHLGIDFEIPIYLGKEEDIFDI